MVTNTSAEDLVLALRRQGLRRGPGVPLYIQIAEALEAGLAETSLPDTDPIPSEPELAQILGVSRPTIRQALGYLEQRSVLYRRRGVGTFRAPHAVGRPPRLRGLFDELAEQGLTPVTRVLTVQRVSASAEIAADLRLAVGTPLVLVERVRQVDGRPIVLHKNYLNLFGETPPDPAELERGSLYTLLRTRYGIELALASQTISARQAERQERKQLMLGQNACVLVAQRVSFDSTGQGIEWAINTYPAGSHSFQMRLTAW
jgi:DNA-binding GntR family transcriptional regulator